MLPLLMMLPEPCRRMWGAACGFAIGVALNGGPDDGDNWRAIVRDLPTVLSVEAQTLP